METGRKSIRRDFSPLTLAVSVEVSTPNSPATQVYNASINQYEPDRSITPTVLAPMVVARANDGSWMDTPCTEFLANVTWLDRGKDISTLQDWKNKYSIGTGAEDRGCLKIFRNLSPKHTCELVMHAELVDSRLGILLPVTSDPVILYTSDKSEDKYSLSIDEDSIITYNPFLDKLSLYNYKVANKMISPDTRIETSSMDSNSYDRKINISLYKGGKKMENGYTVKLYTIINNSNIELISGCYEIVSINERCITLDLRMVEKREYLIKAFIGSKEVDHQVLSVGRSYQRYTCEPTNGTGIHPLDTERYDIARVSWNGSVVDCPERVLKILWKTDTSSLKNNFLNEGRETIFKLKDTGIGDKAGDDWIDVYTESSQKIAYSQAVDDLSNLLTDKQGNNLILN